MERICPKCEDFTDQTPVTRMVSVQVKNKKINIQVDGYVCSMCKDFIYDVEYVLDKAYRVIKKEK